MLGSIAADETPEMQLCPEDQTSDSSVQSSTGKWEIIYVSPFTSTTLSMPIIGFGHANWSNYYVNENQVRLLDFADAKKDMKRTPESLDHGSKYGSSETGIFAVS